jgi:urease accessory protein
MRKYRLAELKPVRWGSGLMILLLPAVAEAHPGGSDTGLMNGLMHPVFGPDHLLAMICVGIVSGQLGGHNIWRIPLAFVAGMTVGGALGIQPVSLPFTELGIAASVLVLGMGVIFAHRHMSPWPITVLIALFGALHGHAHGAEIPKSASPELYTLGLLIGTSVLHIFGMLIGEVASMQRWLWKGLRFTGGAVTASGVAFLLQTFAGTA